MNENPELRESEQKIVTGGEVKKIPFDDVIEDPPIIDGSAVTCPYCFKTFRLPILMETHRPNCPQRPKG